MGIHDRKTETIVAVLVKTCQDMDIHFPFYLFSYALFLSIYVSSVDIDHQLAATTIDRIAHIRITLDHGKVAAFVAVAQVLGVRLQALGNLLLQGLEPNRDRYPHRHDVFLERDLDLDHLFARTIRNTCSCAR